MKIRIKAVITLERDYPPTIDAKTVFLDVCETLKLNTSYRVLKFKDREVELSQRLSDLGLKEGDCLILEPVTVGMLKERICKERGIDPNTVRITYKGRALKDEELLEDLGLEDGDRLIIVTRTVGCQQLEMENKNEDQ